MEHHIGSSSSSDDESAPPVIMPPPLPNQPTVNEYADITVENFEEHRLRRIMNHNRRQQRHAGHEMSASEILAMIDPEAMAPIAAYAAKVEAERIAKENAIRDSNGGAFPAIIENEAAFPTIDENEAAFPTINENEAAFPTINENEASAISSGLGNPEAVRTYKDMFKYATDLADGVPMNIHEDFGVLSFNEEKKKFLSNVLSTMTVNVHEEMNNSINTLFDNQKLEEEYEFAFEVIAEYVDNIDYANDFEKIGGFHIFLPCIRSEHASVRIKVSELIATLVQHNPYCQEKFMENKNYPKALISMVENDLNDEVRVKALAALSSLVRHNRNVFWEFIDLGGKDLLINSLKAPINKLKIKAAFIICSTCYMGNDVAEMYVDNGVVEIISSIIMEMEKEFESEHHELFLSTLNQLIRMSPVRVKEICTSLEDFKLALTSLRDSYSNESNQDEKDQILWLMETLTL